MPAKQNATEYGHPVTGNRIIIKSQATSYDKALSIARGLTAPNQYYDEPEFTPYIATIVKNSVSTFETAHRRSLENGAISARCFTCTKIASLLCTLNLFNCWELSLGHL